MRRTLPRYVSAYADRHGKVRYRFRRAGQKPYSFKSRPGCPEFLLEYQACLAGVIAPTIVVGEARAKPGSFNDLIAGFYRSSLWENITLRSSRATYRGIIERFRAKHGHRMVADLRFIHVDAILAEMAKTPAAANNLRKVLIRLLDFAIKIEMVSRNVVRETEPLKTNPDGWHAWSEDEIELFERRHRLGTKARLAFALLLHTGQRRSDVIRLGPQHVKNGKLTFVQQKTGAEMVIPIHSELAEAIAASRVGHLNFLVTAFGKPFTPAGFGNWFRDRCNEAGLPNCSAHGLRKAFTRRLVHAGLTHAQGKALTGHVTDAEFNRYARSANQEHLADAGMANLQSQLAKTATKQMNRKRKK